MRNKLIIMAAATLLSFQSFASCGSARSMHRAADAHLTNVIMDSSSTMEQLRDAVRLESNAWSAVVAQCQAF